VFDLDAPYSMAPLASPERPKMGRKPMGDTQLLNRRISSDDGDVDMVLKSASALGERAEALLETKSPTLARLAKRSRDLSAVRNRLRDAIGSLKGFLDALERAEDRSC